MGTLWRFSFQSYHVISYRCISSNNCSFLSMIDSFTHSVSWPTGLVSRSLFFGISSLVHTSGSYTRGARFSVILTSLFDCRLISFFMRSNSPEKYRYLLPPYTAFKAPCWILRDFSRSRIFRLLGRVLLSYSFSWSTLWFSLPSDTDGNF